MHAFDYPTLKPRRPKTNPPAREARRGVSGERQGITVPSGALPDPACADGVAVVFTDVSARDLFKVSPDEGVGCELEVRADGVLAPTAVKFGAEGSTLPAPATAWYSSSPIISQAPETRA